MLRAVFFDFYSVWTPDKIAYYLAFAQQVGPDVYKQLTDIVESYYHGQVDVEHLADSFSMKLSNSDIGINQLQLQGSNISPEIIEFMQNLHGHFLKLGILANLGTQEYAFLNDFNRRNQALEVIASPLSFKTDGPLLSKEVFSQALEAIGEPLDSCIWVSGNPIYLQFAASLGMGGVQFEGFPQLKQYLDHLVTSELPQ